MMSRKDLPVSDALRECHAALCRWYEDSQFYMPAAERTVEFDVEAFSAEGFEIARAIAAELPGWTVVYYDDAAAQQAAAEAPRWTFEYTV